MWKLRRGDKGHRDVTLTAFALLTVNGCYSFVCFIAPFRDFNSPHFPNAPVATGQFWHFRSSEE